MKTEKIISPFNGYIAVTLLIITIALMTYGILSKIDVLVITLIFPLVIIIKGMIIINPNNSSVLTLFGDYTGSIKQNGLFWINPFYKRSILSLRAKNFESEKIKVNDKLGNPILISVILVWKVKDTFKAMYEVDNYENFIKIQTDSAVRKLAGSFPYDHS